MSRPSVGDPPFVVQLVEAHDQVDERGLAGAGRADDGDGLTGLGHERERLDEQPVGVVGKGDVAELDPAAPASAPRWARDRIGDLLLGVEELGHQVRTAVIPGWNTFIIDGSCVSGIEKLREYWMNAWMLAHSGAPLWRAIRKPLRRSRTGCSP